MNTQREKWTQDGAERNGEIYKESRRARQIKGERGESRRERDV